MTINMCKGADAHLKLEPIRNDRCSYPEINPLVCQLCTGVIRIEAIPKANKWCPAFPFESCTGFTNLTAGSQSDPCSIRTDTLSTLHQDDAVAEAVSHLSGRHQREPSLVQPANVHFSCMPFQCQASSAWHAAVRRQQLHGPR